MPIAEQKSLKNLPCKRPKRYKKAHYHKTDAASDPLLVSHLRTNRANFFFDLWWRWSQYGRINRIVKNHAYNKLCNEHFLHLHTIPSYGIVSLASWWPPGESHSRYSLWIWICHNFQFFLYEFMKPQPLQHSGYSEESMLNLGQPCIFKCLGKLYMPVRQLRWREIRTITVQVLVRWYSTRTRIIRLCTLHL